MKTLTVALLFAGILSPRCFGQTTTPATPAAKKPIGCQSIIKCRAELKEATEAANQFSDIADKLTIERDSLAAKNKELEATNTKLTERLDGAETVMRVLDKEMKFAPLSEDDKKAINAVHDDDILNLGVAIENDQKEYVKVAEKLSSDNDSVVRKYNALLSDYKDYVSRVGIQLAAIGQANRVSNALALYNALPKYTPPQQVNVQIMNCTALPALCVH
jgi:hypothetical protein